MEKAKGFVYMFICKFIVKHFCFKQFTRAELCGSAVNQKFIYPEF